MLFRELDLKPVEWFTFQTQRQLARPIFGRSSDRIPLGALATLTEKFLGFAQSIVSIRS
jgi:hypothetical protein